MTVYGTSGTTRPRGAIGAMAPLGHVELTKMQKFLEAKVKTKTKMRNKMKRKIKPHFCFHFVFHFVFVLFFIFVFVFCFSFSLLFSFPFFIVVFVFGFGFRSCFCFYFIFLVFIFEFTMAPLGHHTAVNLYLLFSPWISFSKLELLTLKREWPLKKCCICLHKRILYIGQKL